ncbi:beta-glucosidase [Acetobacter sp. LMG 1627]|uniref:Beta-glucosidase n=2 Tax=Acetobacter conturbans TaxID=1737472 RepID=A0ABX0K1L4_9PROT|nr:beta-glucosidase [Acetobacter conturbans]
MHVGILAAISQTLPGVAAAQSRHQNSEQRVDALLARMSLDEKIQLVHGGGMGSSPIGGGGYIKGIPRLGIPDINYVDSDAGINVQGKHATPLPSPLALAASWDVNIARDYGVLVAHELKTLGFNSGLGNGINLAREPRNGRTFEYMGEDPILAGILFAARTQGAQSQNILTVMKHFAANDQETNRFTSDSIIDERTLRELYLRGFELAVDKANPAVVMCAYNLVNGEKSCENRHLLTDILKGDWGFQGYVQSDWIAAITNTRRAANAGTDEEEPGSADDSLPGPAGLHTFFNQRLKEAVRNGQVSEARLDDMVRRKLRSLDRAGLINIPTSPVGKIDTAAGDILARRVEQNAIVLLKNDPSGADSHPTLPLVPSSMQTVVVIGGHADAGVISGGGSAGVPARDGNAVTCGTPGAVDPFIHQFSLCATWYKSSPLEAIRARLPGKTVRYLDGKDAAAAALAAAQANVAIIFATQFTTEQVDLPRLSLPDDKSDPANQSYDQNNLISTVAARARRTIVVLEQGTAVTMPWLNHVQSVLVAWYPGVQGGPAIADVLFGEVNPSGKLPLSFPKREDDLPQKTIPTTALRIPYTEGLKMGYRWYDSQKIEPLFPFGYGLSYTHFSYSGLQAKRLQSGDVSVQFRLTNDGDRRGKETAQVYSALPANTGEPPRRLVAWEKVDLAPTEAREITLTIPAARFAVWAGRWQIPGGTAHIEVGGSSRDPHMLEVPLRFMSANLGVALHENGDEQCFGCRL